MPELDLTGEHQDGEEKSEKHLDGLIEDEQLVAILPVGEDTPEDPKKEAGQALKNVGDSHQEGGAGQEHDQPADRHQLHVIPGMGQHTPNPEQPVISIPESSESL